MNRFPFIVRELGRELAWESAEVDVGEWQSLDITGKSILVTQELTHVTFRALIPQTLDGVMNWVKPNLRWAEDHFLERVSGKPLNPPPSHEWWPFAQHGNDEHTTVKGSKFSHTYPERFWPKWADDAWDVREAMEVTHGRPNHGIRYDFGDLDDLVTMLVRNPLTRQAYLPVWFPEDTGAVHGERVPCTLGYHFLIRNNRLDIDYHIRSCDFLRHFRDDVYMAMRLAQWVRDELVARREDLRIEVHEMVMHIGSLHVFAGDMPKMRRDFAR